MIVEPTNLTKKSCHQYKMPMSKLTLKQNGHSSINENRADDDYGGGGHEKKPSIDTRKARFACHRISALIRRVGGSFISSNDLSSIPNER